MAASGLKGGSAPRTDCQIRWSILLIGYSLSPGIGTYNGQVRPTTRPGRADRWAGPGAGGSSERVRHPLRHLAHVLLHLQTRQPVACLVRRQVAAVGAAWVVAVQRPHHVVVRGQRRVAVRAWEQRLALVGHDLDVGRGQDRRWRLVAPGICAHARHYYAARTTTLLVKASESLADSGRLPVCL